MAKVFLSAGHGGSDPGAVANGLSEKNINLAIMLSCADYLRKCDVEVVTSRTTDENDPVGEEVREANASGADIAVSFHNNVGGGNGSESYIWAGCAEGKKLATLLEQASQSLGQNSRGVKGTRSLYFIKNTTMTACLVETAFLDSDDRFIIDEASEQNAFGVAYAKAILEYFGMSVEIPAAPEKEPVKEEKDYLYMVNVKITNLLIRKGPGTNYARVTLPDGSAHIKPGPYRIVEESAGAGSNKGWGKLYSGAGWIALDYAEKI